MTAAPEASPQPPSPDPIVRSTLRLGEMLIARRLIQPEDLERALELQRERGDKLGKILVDMGFIAHRDVLAALSEQLGLPLVTPDSPPPAAPELEGLSARFMRQSRFVPLAIQDSTLTLAMADPLDFETIAAVRAFSGLKIETALASEQEILDAIDKHYGEAAKQSLDAEFGTAQASEDLEHLRDMASEAPVIRLVNAMIAQAIEQRASDIHIEPFEKEFRVRFRVDGVLFNQEAPPRELKFAVISRLKLMAKLNIAERRLPQDGRIKIKILGREVDLRVSTLPTLYGESVVMRLLDRSAGDFYDLRRLGFDDGMLSRMEHFTSLPHGIFLVTGPTGSGKSTTLYSALKRINIPDKKIITIEDPVEYQMDGINQIHVNPQIGLTFAAGLAAHRAPGSGRHHGGRNPRPRDGGYRYSRGPHRPPGFLHAAHQRCAQRHHPAYRHGSGELSGDVVAGSGAGAAAGAVDLPALQDFGGRRHIARRRAHGKLEAAPAASAATGPDTLGRMGIFEMMEINDEIRTRIMANEDASAADTGRAPLRHAQPARRRLAQDSHGRDHGVGSGPGHAGILMPATLEACQ